jgi:ribosome-binding ATPase YchF (GTP1/OBG family)
MSDDNQLRRRRDELEIQLIALTEQRERAFRVNSDALALQQAGVTHRDSAAMKQLADAESAGDSAMTALRREIEAIDNELARDHRGGLAGIRRTVMSRRRR